MCSRNYWSKPWQNTGKLKAKDKEKMQSQAKKRNKYNMLGMLTCVMLMQSKTETCKLRNLVPFVCQAEGAKWVKLELQTPGYVDTDTEMAGAD